MLSKELTVISGIAGQVLLYYLIGINVLTFLLFGLDKRRARQGKWRVSEATLLILSVIPDHSHPLRPTPRSAPHPPVKVPQPPSRSGSVFDHPLRNNKHR